MRRLHRKMERFAGPPWPRPVRLALALLVIIAGFICQHFHLTSAHTFGLIGFTVAAMVLLVKRILWKRSLSQRTGDQGIPT